MFPIGFDLEAAVNDTIKKWNSGQADRLEKALQKRALEIKLKLNTKLLDNLDDVKKRLAQLKIEPITPETRIAIKELAIELKQLAKALEQVQKYSKTTQLGQQNFRNDVQMEKLRQANERLEIQKRRVALAEQKHADAMQRSAERSKQLGNEYQKQSSYLNNLLKKTATLWSLHRVQSFLTNVRDVTAQFELQRISLGAILQDQNKANQLFSEIKSFALKSPVKILDLTKYTKQLAAYKIGYDELFETTKRLTDVSVSLGVSMDRVVLAYGQVRATGYLRASEIRQFTEMGVPIVEELAVKLSKMNGELVTAADVMDLVSKRGISFELVKDVFNDLTSAGGIFYNMQEKQGNTLYGMWAKLGDAASVMYEQIGNTDSVNKGMKDSISLLTEFMRNWQAVGKTIATIGAVAGIGMLGKSALRKGESIEAQKVATATRNRAIAQSELNIQLKIGTQADIAAARAALNKAQADEKATIAASKSVTAIGNLKTGFISLGKTLLTGLGIGLVISLVTTFIYKLYEAWENAHRLKNELKDIATENMAMQAQQVRQFEFLADKATNVTLSDKERNEALQELHRTFKEAIPIENMSIENLQRMAAGATDATHKYIELTDTLKEYIAEQNRQKTISAIQAELQPKINKEIAKMRKVLEGQGYDYAEQARFVSEITSVFSDPNKIGRPIHDNVVEALRNAGIDGGDELADRLINGSSWDRFVRDVNKIGSKAANLLMFIPNESSFMANLPLGIISMTADTEKHVDNFAKLMGNMNALNEEYTDKLKEQTKDLGVYNDEWERVQKTIADNQKYASNDTDKFLVSQENKNNRIKAYISTLQTQMGAYWDNSFATIEETVGESGEKMSQIFFEKFNDPKWLAQLPIDLQKYISNVQKAYYELEPKDNLINAINRKFTSLAIGAEANMANMTKYTLKDGDKIEDKLKSLTSSLDDVNAKIYQYEQTNEKVKRGELGFVALVPQEKINELKNESKALALFIELLSGLLAPKATGGRQSDPRLQNLKEEISLYEKLYQEYKQYEKAVGSSKAAEYMEREAKDTIDALAKKYGIGLPKNVTDLTSALEILYKKMQALPSKVFKNLDKELKEFRWKIEKVDIDDSQKKIEAQLKELTDRISRTKTAREFYDKVLNLIGDNKLASKVAESIFGQNGSELRKALADQMRGMTGDIPLPDDIISADNIIDYKALRGFAEANKTELGNMYDELVKISDNGQRDLAKTYEGYLKDLEKAKTYSDKRIELARYTANKIAEINASTIPQEEKERLTAGYQERETQKRGEIEWEAFKDMPIYVQMFDDLDNASTTVLSNMKDKLLELQSVWGASLNPTQLKELQSRLNEIDAQLVKKNPFKTLSDAMKEYRSLSKTGTQADAERGLTEATDRQIAAQQKLNIALNVSRTAQDKYNDAVSEYGADSEQAKNAKMLWDAAEQGVDDASKLVEQTGLSAKEAQRLVEAWKKVKDAIGLSLGEVFQIAHSLGDLAGGIGKLTEVFGGSEEDVQYWNDIANGLNEVTSGIENMVQASISGNPIGIVTSAITAIPNMISGFSNLFSAGKVKRANKEIKKQQNLLEQLEYTYERLEHSSDKLFGRDYIDNYNKRLENLQMQAVSYQKMYEAEKSKGKKKDKQKLKEYEKAYQETMDEIADMQNDLVAKFTGSTRSDIARQMAQSWIDARASMSDTFAAIKGDYQDLIKNMIVEGAAARVVENALSPMWDKMDKMLADNDIDGAIDALVGGMDSALNAANNGMETLWQALEAKGYDMKKLLSDTDTSEYTGIAKSVSSATSEEINANTAALNTQNYYISHIDENVAAMYMLMRAGMGGETQVTTSAGWTDWQQQAMDSYLAIQRNTADTVVECRRAANACEEAVNKMSRVIKVKGATQGFNVFLNS